MSATYPLFATMALPALVAGCAATFGSQTLGTADADIHLEMASSALVFRDVRIETTPEGSSQVTGSLRRIGHRPVRAGHIRYRLTDKDGAVLEQGQASDGRPNEGFSRRHLNPMSTFVIPLQTPWIPGQHRLCLKWDTPTKPPHSSPTGAGGQA